MNRLPIKDWLKDPHTTAAEKALFATAALTYFCLPLGTAPSTIAASLCAAIWFFSGIAIKKRYLYWKQYWWPVFGLIVLPWIGMLYTQDVMGLGIDYAEKTYYWLFSLVVAAIAFEHFSSARLVQAFMLGLGINVVAAIAQIIFHLHDDNLQHRGLGPDYSTLSAYLIVGIMMAVFFLHRQQHTRHKIALTGLIGLYFFHLVILHSRASYIAFVLLAPFMGMTLFKTRKIIKTTAICLLVPALMLLSPIVRQRVERSVSELTYHLDAEDTAAWGHSYSPEQDRFYMWNRALRIIREHPFFGVGTGGYQSVLKAMDTDPAIPAIAHPHNNFLYMVVSYGAMGLIVFVWFLWATIASGWRYRHTAAGYMLLSVVSVLVTTGLFNSQILDVGTAFLLSLTIGLEPAFQWSDGDA
jgi:hypothetical protein